MLYLVEHGIYFLALHLSAKELNLTWSLEAPKEGPQVLSLKSETALL